MSFAMNSSLQNPSSSNSHPLQKDVSSPDHQVALELERLHELRRQVSAQEQKLQSLRQQAANSEDSHSLLTAEQGVMKSLIFTKEKELALALMKVAELTSQLEHLRRGHVDDTSNKSSQKRIECTGPLVTCEAVQYQKGSHQKAIPIRIIKESVLLNNDLRKNSTSQNVEENSKSDRERGVRIIPIFVEKKTAGIPIDVVVTESKGHQGSIGVPIAVVSESKGHQGSIGVPIAVVSESKGHQGSIDVPIAVVTEGKGHQGSIDVTSNKTVLNQNFKTAVQNATDTSQTTDVSNKKGFSSDIRSSSMTNNLSSNKKIENGVRSLTADLKDIKTDTESEKKANNIEGSLTVHSESSFGIECGSKEVDTAEIIPLQSSEESNVAGSLSDDRKIQDGQNSIYIGEDRNCTGNVFRDLSKTKTAVVTNSSAFDKKENGFDVFADDVFVDEHDVSNTNTVVCDKTNDSNIGHFSSEETNGSMLKTFSQSKKSFSDFSLSSQLGQPTREFFSSRNQAGQTARVWDSGSSLTKQSQPSADVGKSAIKNDRARFFMDMVREDDASVGNSQPLLESVRGRVLVEVKPSASSAGSTTTSRGRSSSSAIMSRFAPQPYGRSKSVDSASLRIPMMAVHGAVRREQSPEVMGVDSKPVSSCIITSSSEPNPPSFSSLTILRPQTVTLSPVLTVATKATQEKPEVAAVSGLDVPSKEVTVSKTGIANSQLSTGNFNVFDKPSYAIPTVSPLSSLSQKKIINTASLEKSMPDSRHLLSKTAAPGITTGDSESPTTKAVTEVVTGTALSHIDPSAIVLGEMESYGASVRYTATGPKSPPTSSQLVVTSLSGVVPFATAPQTSATATVVTSVRTEVCTPLAELDFSKSKLAASSDMTAVVSCTKSGASVSVSPSLSPNAGRLSDPKMSPFTGMPVGARVLKGNSLVLEPPAGDFRTVSDITQSTSPPVTALADSESTTGLTSVGTIPKAQLSVSKAEDLQCAEEMADTPWDSNVKRLAQIFAVTIGGTVKNKVNLRSSRSKVSDYAAGTNNCAEVAPLTGASNQDVLSVSANRTEHSKKETADGKSSVTSSANVSASIGDLGRSLPSASRGAVSPSAQHQQFSISTVDHSHSMNRLPSQPSPDITQMPYYKVRSLEQSKIDTSADSVSTALSVLLQNNSSGHSSPVRPSRLRTTISSAYRRKLGSGALDNYSQNMTLLYGDCTAKKDDMTSSDVQDSSTESIVSPPLLEVPLIDDLPRILALDTLDGMPFYPRLGSHTICRENEISGEGMMDNKLNDQSDNCNESLKTGDVELTVIANPVQVADLVHLDSVETVAPSTLGSFSPSDELVPSYIDDPETSDKDRFISETPARPSSRRVFRKDGKPLRRVTFDPVSLLLNAALEGEKDLVVDVVNKIANPNHKTENGLSALHNAVCSGHLDVVRYLVTFGCDVNAIDNDGWTPLHCAASSNNLELMRILVENGASILPMTISDRETPVQKCSRNLPGYEEAVRYLNDVARNLGAEKDGWIYATSNFANVCSDELVLQDGDRLKVLRRGDESETEWWWARDEKNAEGYVPQSLLAPFPRIQPKWLK